MTTLRGVLAGTNLALLLATSALAADAGPGTVQRQNNMKEALATPLEDTNLRRVEIPPVLRQAMANPYDLRGLSACAGLAAEIRRLDEALGPDLDIPRQEAEASRVQQAKSGAVVVARVGAQMLMPFRGVVRQLSGANAHQREVSDAVYAGAARRGFLKGVGMRMNCTPPAAPWGFKPAPARAPAQPAPRR